MMCSRPLLSQEHLLLRVHGDRAGGPSQRVDYVVDCPAGDALPEVIRIVDEEEEEEDQGEFEGVSDDEFEEDQDMDSEEEEEELSDMEEDWTSEDSGYSTVTDDEDLDDDEDGDGVILRSPLNQQMPPEEFWQGWRRADPPAPCPRHLTSSPSQAYPRISEVFSLAAPCSSLAPPAFSQRPEECAPSTSGHSSATKRSREESDTEQVSTKRQRWSFEESDEESAPSTSGLGRFTSRSEEEGYRESAASAISQIFHQQETLAGSAPKRD